LRFLNHTHRHTHRHKQTYTEIQTHTQTHRHKQTHTDSDISSETATILQRRRSKKWLRWRLQIFSSAAGKFHFSVTPDFFS